MACDAHIPRLWRDIKIANPQNAAAGMNLKLLAVGQKTNHQTAQFRDQTLRPRVRGKELSLKVFRGQLGVGVAYVPGQFDGQPCDRSSVGGRCSPNHAFSTCRHEAFDLSCRESVYSPRIAPCAALSRNHFQQFFDLTQLRHPLTHHCQLVAGDLLDFAAMPAVL